MPATESLAFQPLSARLARLLLDRSERSGRSRAPRDLTLDDMASRLGTTREVVCRLLYRLAAEGLIEISRTEFSFLDRDGLAKLAGAGDGKLTTVNEKRPLPSG